MSLVLSVQPDSLTRGPLLQGRLSSNRGQQVKYSEWVLQMANPMTSPFLLPVMLLRQEINADGFVSQSHGLLVGNAFSILIPLGYYADQARCLHSTLLASLLTVSLLKKRVYSTALLHLLPASTSTYIFHDTNKMEVVDYLRRFSINYLTTTHPPQSYIRSIFLQ